MRISSYFNQREFLHNQPQLWRCFISPLLGVWTFAGQHTKHVTHSTWLTLQQNKTSAIQGHANRIDLSKVLNRFNIDDSSSPFFFIGCKTMGPKLCFLIYVPSTKLPGMHPMSETWATRTFVHMARSPFWSPLFFHLIIQFPSFGVLWHKEIYKRYLKHKKQYVEHHINNQVDVGTYVKHTLQQKRPPCILNNQQSWQNNWMVCWKLCNVEK